MAETAWAIRGVLPDASQTTARRHRATVRATHWMTALCFVALLVDRKSTRLNSSHRCISYAVFCLKKKRAIPHLEVIRISSRVPCHLPERITPELFGILKQYHPLYINTHFNHPDELTPVAVAVLGRLADAGVPLGCQTVLLKGVNDDPEVTTRLLDT